MLAISYGHFQVNFAESYPQPPSGFGKLGILHKTGIKKIAPNRISLAGYLKS